ncbi:MBL fold metallo-hydrolase [Fictibacillus fluitans]|uniref:MBL fold metallo-hydrolase n=1 Tax=Fictibacillus fluitans TaxID=3058422 RepID=A0ABT8I1U0_9BACL|nr:MBL fold metallo-hydrolase [Fictibacillus sp. NE201]MDN4526989.1 MBL fold metallo-hydrolase [Fictibacillus sp. NE201]
MKESFIPVTSIASGIGQEVMPDLYYFPVQIVNVVFAGTQNEWVLIDAGMPKSADKIIEEAEKRFGEGTRPRAIILTHGHFDHTGALRDLVERWKVPVYAHILELPYLTGKKDYPKPDSSVGGGLVSSMAPMFPNEALHLEDEVVPLPEDGTIPFMKGWRWIHTPGHTPGHVSFFRESDASLIAGDAFVTVKQESLYKVMTQKQEISGPPKYLTTDWDAAYESVRKLAALKPQLAVTGHGLPMACQLLGTSLEKLVDRFYDIAVPEHGKYVNEDD